MQYLNVRFPRKSKQEVNASIVSPLSSSVLRFHGRARTERPCWRYCDARENIVVSLLVRGPMLILSSSRGPILDYVNRPSIPHFEQKVFLLKRSSPRLTDGTQRRTKTHRREANFAKLVSQNDDAKAPQLGRNGTWVPRITKPTPIRLRQYDTVEANATLVEAVWILDFDFHFGCKGESLPSFS